MLPRGRRSASSLRGVVDGSEWQVGVVKEEATLITDHQVIHEHESQSMAKLKSC